MKDKMVPVLDSNTSMYRLQPGLPSHHGPDLTPHSAVSSFNLPAAYDSSLITPVSMTSSPNMSAKSGPGLLRDPNVHLSPLLISPTTSYQLGWEGETYSPAYLHAVKPKDRSGSLHISSVDSVFPPSPSYIMPPSMYYGNYPVSAPTSARTSESSPSLHQSPQLQQHSPHISAGLMSNSTRHSMHHSSPNGSMFRQTNPAPIIMPPTQINRRASTATNQGSRPARHSSKSSTRSLPPSQSASHGIFSENMTSQSSAGKKGQRKKGLSEESFQAMLSSGNLDEGERLLMVLSHNGDLKWKEIANRWSEKMSQRKTDSALQMRKKRLLDRLRDKAMEESVDDYQRAESDIKWEFVKDNTGKNVGRQAWSGHDMQKHYHSVHSQDHRQDFEEPPRKRSCSSSDSHSVWSDGYSSSRHQSLENGETANLASALSTTTMDEVRSRAASDASVHLQQQHHQQQHEHQRQAQMLFEHHNQHNQHNQHLQNNHNIQQQQHSWAPGT